MARRVLTAFLSWWNSPRLFDQFVSIFDSKDVLELTEDMRYYPRGVDPFGRFKRKQDATSR